MAPERDPARREERVLELGRRLLAEARTRRTAFWARERWEELLLQRLMASEAFRLQALRFVDVLPVLDDDEELVRHVREYFQDEELPIPGLARWGIARAGSGVASHLLAGAVRGAIQGLASRFIGGDSVAAALESVQELRRDGMAFTLDLLGEATVSEAEAEGYARRYDGLLEEMAPKVARWKPNPLLDRRGDRDLPRLNLSVKVSSLCSNLMAVDPDGSVARLQERLRPILRLARRHGAFICLDMEQYDLKEIVLRVFRETLMEPEFRDWPHAGIALQAYLRDAELDLAELIAWAGRRGTPVTVRLVRGAYWDYETVVARQHGWPVPVWTRKADTDRCYERCLDLLFRNAGAIDAAVATHNVRSLAAALVLAEEYGVAPDCFEVQMLYGMADPLKDAVAKLDRRVRVYVPFGELLPGMSYLVRRLLENTASQSFLRMGFAEDAPPEKLLAPPPAIPSEPAAPSPAGGLPPFRNEPVRRFTTALERDRFRAALARVRGRMGEEYPLLLHGRPQFTGEWLESRNPARPDELVGRVASAAPGDVEAALRSAAAAFPDWRDRPAAARAALLFAAAARLRERRDEFAALEVFEAGKTWSEADGDVTEAIDFLEYYGREAIRLDRPLPLHVPGETNFCVYQPRGIAAVIPPWNFPLAILTGMLSAALAAGNSAILKPASQTPVVAAWLVQLLEEVGLPEGVVNFVPGPGAAVGEALVCDPRTALIAFTGSREVGTRICRLAAEIAPGQDHLKRVIAELGGKNAVIVDSDADLDDAVLGVLQSAFGYQGQKCSAASRVIVVGSLYESFTRRLVEAARSLIVGMPEDPAVRIGPVIDERARKNILAAIAAGREVAPVLLETDVSHLEPGSFVGPTVFGDVPPASPLAQEEIFGPVLAVMRAESFDEALRIANDVRYALTGGVYSRSPSRLARARREFRVGNLYLNRKITGAVVNRQPFGGFKMSGIGSKAGGPDYLLQFLEPRTITENTIRRGFAPEDGEEELDWGLPSEAADA